MSEKLKLRNNRIYLLAPLLVILDQVSKIFASDLARISCNKGIIFGMFSGGVLNLILPLAVLLFLGYLILTEKDQLTAMSLILIISGGVSNFFDRIFLGCVRDFISIDFWPSSHWLSPSLTRWPSFNLADIMITLGAVFLFYSLFRKPDGQN